MGDRAFFVLVALAAAAMIGFALVWPVGEGAPAPAPFDRLPQPLSPPPPTPA